MYAATLLCTVLIQALPTTQSTLQPAGPASRTISNLSWIVYVIFLVVALVMWVLITWVAVRRKGTFAEHEPIEAGGGQTWILIGGFAIPFVILSFIFVIGLQAMERFPLPIDSHSSPDIQVIGHQWWWEIHYLDGPPDKSFVTANEIHIPVGQAVNIELRSNDVIHSFWVPTLHGKEDLIPGQPNRIRIRADQAGVY